eukprot:COSAG03_NODE_917_length_5334_cov_28.906399_4_plen_73_part_00
MEAGLHADVSLTTATTAVRAMATHLGMPMPGNIDRVDLGVLALLAMRSAGRAGWIRLHSSRWLRSTRAPVLG